MLIISQLMLIIPQINVNSITNMLIMSQLMLIISQLMLIISQLILIISQLMFIISQN